MAETAKRVLLLGDGAWGTALALVLVENGHRPALWGNFPDYSRRMRETRVNETFLPGIALPDMVEITSEMAEPMAEADLLVFSTPVVHLRKVMQKAKPHYARRAGLPVMVVAKGIENGTLMRASEIVSDELDVENVGVLFGPSHAEEVARRLPTAVVAAAPRAAFAQEIQQTFMTDRLRVYTSQDTVGLELGAALKNVIAIAAGVCDGLGFGDNAKAGLITRGLAEITRLGVAMGAQAQTFAGLAGLGDLITTCVSPYGRNRAVGEAIGKGKTLAQVLEDMGQVVAEGVWTTRSACALADKCGVEMPITREVYRLLFEDKPPLDAVSDLMLREAKPERE